MARRKRITPLPAAIPRTFDPESHHDKPWRITAIPNLAGQTDLDGREMFVPTDDKPQSLGVRQHEMLHVAMSPMPDGPMDFATLGAEDGRVETLASTQGITRERTLTRDELRKTLLKASTRNRPDIVASYAVAALGSPEERDVREILAGMGKSDLVRLMDDARAAYLADPSFASTERVAGMVRALRPDEPPDEGQEGSQSRPDAPTAGHGIMRPATPTEPPTAPPEPPTEPPPPPAEPQATPDQNAADGIHVFRPGPPAKPTYSEDSEEWATWAPATVETPARHVTKREKGSGSRKAQRKASDSGTRLGNLGRAPIDGRVFQARRHRKQGSVLLDLSGSTSYLQQIVPDLIAKVPASVIAGYWGVGGRGIIRVLAANGKTVSADAMAPTGGENEIDAPAAEWLAHQKRPRVWVFDNYPTGKYGALPSREMLAEIERIVSAGGIKRINPDDYLAEEPAEMLAHLTRRICDAMR